MKIPRTIFSRVISFWLPGLFLLSCNAELKKTTSEEFLQTVSGEAQGTTWRVVYYDLQERDLKPQIDSILRKIDESVSTYLPGSTIDLWNKSDSGAVIDQLFLELLLKSRDIYNLTNGAFDPTVKPLVSYWGFGPERFQHPDKIDSATIDSLLNLVHFEALELLSKNKRSAIGEFENKNIATNQTVFLRKPLAEMQLDFNAIGQGWSADKIAQFLNQKGLKLYFVEIGGEIVAGHPKPDGSLWRFGIDKPKDNNQDRELQAIVNLRNKGLATSGNYRKFYEKDGMKYAHTIDPKTGYPVQHNLLSATVVSRDAAKSDALATAFMVMGNDSTIRFLRDKPYLATYIYLIQADSNGNYTTFTSQALQKLIEEIE
ncbi:MAG: FAD:protein FMN transferase [Salibacteraceae bacterium]